MSVTTPIHTLTEGRVVLATARLSVWLVGAALLMAATLKTADLLFPDSDSLNASASLPQWYEALRTVGTPVEFVFGTMLLSSRPRPPLVLATSSLVVVFIVVSLVLYFRNPGAECGCIGDTISLPAAANLLISGALLVCLGYWLRYSRSSA